MYQLHGTADAARPDAEDDPNGLVYISTPGKHVEEVDLTAGCCSDAVVAASTNPSCIVPLSQQQQRQQSRTGSSSPRQVDCKPSATTATLLPLPADDTAGLLSPSTSVTVTVQPSASAVSSLGQAPDGATPSAPLVIALPTAVVLALALCVYNGGEVGYGGWLVQYLVERGLLGEGTGSVMASLFWAGLASGRLLGAFSAMKFSVMSILFTAAGLSLVPIVLVAAMPDNVMLLWIASVRAVP